MDVYRHLGILWLNFLGVDLRVCGHNTTPPLHLVLLQKVTAMISGSLLWLSP